MVSRGLRLEAFTKATFTRKGAFNMGWSVGKPSSNFLTSALHGKQPKRRKLLHVVCSSEAWHIATCTIMELLSAPAIATNFLQLWMLFISTLLLNSMTTCCTVCLGKRGPSEAHCSLQRHHHCTTSTLVASRVL